MKICNPFCVNQPTLCVRKKINSKFNRNIRNTSCSRLFKKLVIYDNGCLQSVYQITAHSYLYVSLMTGWLSFLHTFIKFIIYSLCHTVRTIMITCTEILIHGIRESERVSTLHFTILTWYYWYELSLNKLVRWINCRLFHCTHFLCV